MATFKPGEFLQALKDHKDDDISYNVESCKKLRRSDLVLLSRHEGWTFKANAKKAELSDIVHSNLVELELLPESVLDGDKDEGRGEESLDSARARAELIKAEAMAKAEIIRANAEGLKLQMTAEVEAESRKVEAAAAAEKLRAEATKIQAETKLREAELLELQTRIEQRGTGQNVQFSLTRPEMTFDTTRHVIMVPSFQDKDLDSFFQTFEYNAAALQWPPTQWTILLGTVLKGKAQVAYSALSVEEKADYPTVKTAVLSAYELVPEAYRQKFRNLKRNESQT